MRGDQIDLIRRLKSEGTPLAEISARVGVEVGDVQTAVTMLDFMAQETELVSPGRDRSLSFPFQHDTPGLAAGVEVYTPAVGDWLLDARFEIATAWNGTTPIGELGTFLSGWNQGMFALLSPTSVGVDMTKADICWDSGLPITDPGAAGFTAGNPGAPSLSALQAISAVLTRLEIPAIASTPTAVQSLIGSPGPAATFGLLPSRFLSPDPLKVVVSQDGTNTGAAPGATQGAAVLHLLISGPS